MDCETKYCFPCSDSLSTCYQLFKQESRIIIYSSTYPLECPHIPAQKQGNRSLNKMIKNKSVVPENYFKLVPNNPALGLDVTHWTFYSTEGLNET